MESIRKSEMPTATTLLAAKSKNIDLNWKVIVKSLLLVGDYEAAKFVCSQQGTYDIISFCQYNIIIIYSL